MSHCRGRCAFTLIELLAMTVLLVGAVGWATLSMQGIGDNGSIEAAAEQIKSAYQLAGLSAAGGGLPTALRCEASTCVIRKPRLIDGEWSWADAAAFALPQSVKIQSVTGPGIADRASVSGPWDVAVSAYPGWWAWTIRLCIGLEPLEPRRCADLRIDAFSGECELRFVDSRRGT